MSRDVGPGRQWVRQHRVLVFVVLAYTLSWSSWLPLVLAGRVVRHGGQVSQFPGLLGPALAAVVVTAASEGTQGLRHLATTVGRWRVRPLWWFLALASPLLVAAVTVAVLEVVGDAPALSGFGRMPGLPDLGLLGTWGALVVINGLGEEIGWRGLLLPDLRQRHSLVRSALLVLPIWAGWHVPLFLLLQSYRDLGAVALPGFLLGLAAGSLVLAWLRERSGSVLIVAAWHGTYNLVAATESSSGAVAAAVSTAVMVAAAAILVAERPRSGQGELRREPARGSCCSDVVSVTPGTARQGPARSTR